jgi:hypothetical protein
MQSQHLVKVTFQTRVHIMVDIMGCIEASTYDFHTKSEERVSDRQYTYLIVIVNEVHAQIHYR